MFRVAQHDEFDVILRVTKILLFILKMFRFVQHNYSLEFKYCARDVVLYSQYLVSVLDVLLSPRMSFSASVIARSPFVNDSIRRFISSILKVLIVHPFSDD